MVLSLMPKGVEHDPVIDRSQVGLSGSISDAERR